MAKRRTIINQEIIKMPKFNIGDKAYKPKGYKFPCTIVSIFWSSQGIRIVGEMDDYGLLHIFNENQLEHTPHQVTDDNVSDNL
mgnify:CR=1 FL=1